MPVSPKLSDVSIKAPSRLLAEALRELLDASPSDDVPGQPVGTLKVDRAYLAVFELGATNETIISLVAADQTGETITREFRTDRQVSIFVSVQRKLSNPHDSPEGTTELNELVDYSERVLRVCLDSIVDVDGNKYVAETFISTGRDEGALLEWGQFTEIHSVDYKAIVQ